MKNDMEQALRIIERLIENGSALQTTMSEARDFVKQHRGTWSFEVYNIVWGNTCDAKFLEVDGNERIARRDLPTIITESVDHAGTLLGSSYIWKNPTVGDLIEPENITEYLYHHICARISQEYGYVVDECVIMRTD